jgi:hypothetical protein
MVAYQGGTIFAAASSSQTAAPSASAMEKGCNYLITTDGTTVRAQNCDTGNIDYSGTAPQTVISGAISALNGGGKVVLEPATYTFTARLTISTNGVTLQGEGGSSIIAVSSGTNFTPITVNATSVTISNLMLDATNQAKGQGHNGILVAGQNDTITGMSIKNADHGAIYVVGKYVNIYGNLIYDQYDDGITVATGAAFVNVRDNVINGVRWHNGVSLVTAWNVTVTGNRISNAGGDGIGIENLGAGPCKYLNVIGNTITKSATTSGGGGITTYAASGSVESGDWINIADNVITQATFGIQLLSGNDINVIGNVISNTTHSGIYSGGSTPTTNVTIIGNTLNYVATTAGGAGIAIGAPSSGTIYGAVISNNLIRMPAIADIGIQVSTANTTVISGNSVFFAGPPSSGASYGIKVVMTDHGTTIAGNHIVYASGGILLYGNIDETVISSNVVEGANVIGIYLWANSTIYNFSIIGNSVNGKQSPKMTSAGLALYNGVRQGVVSGNTIIGSGKSSGTTDCIRLIQSVYNVTVTGNSVDYCTNGIYEYGNAPPPDYNLITGNVIGTEITNGIILHGSHSVAVGNGGVSVVTNPNTQKTQVTLVYIALVVIPIIIIFLVLIRRHWARKQFGATGN